MWSFEGLAIWSALQGLGIKLGCLSMMLVIGVVSLSTLLPSAPGFMGTYQYAYALVLSLLGYGAAKGVAAAVTVQVFLMGTLTVTGIMMYVLSFRGKKERICVE